jgi:AcrR family transcriptional regulator
MTKRPRRVKRKAYESAIRTEGAEKTRAAILAAARRLLIERGFEAMTMQAVAADAGVALDTVYATVGKKPLLVRLIIEAAIAHRDDREVAVAERDYVVRIRAARTAGEKLRIYGAAVAKTQSQMAPINRALNAAAPAHPELAALANEIAKRRLHNMRILARELLDTGELRRGLTVERVADVLWATNSSELYWLLVDERGWSGAELGEWLAESWIRLFL